MPGSSLRESGYLERDRWVRSCDLLDLRASPADELRTVDRRGGSGRERVIPLGTQTLSKSPTQFVQGVAADLPRTRRRAPTCGTSTATSGSTTRWRSGRCILGYAEPVVDEADPRAQLDEGITFTLMHPLEVEVAERIVALCPGVEAVRFGKSGSDAMSGAVRAARAITGRDLVLVAGYHGWHDWYIGTTTRDRGRARRRVAELTDDVPVQRPRRRSSALLERHRGEVAAVVLEPSGADRRPTRATSQAVVDLAHGHGARVGVRRDHHRLPPRSRRRARALRRRARHLVLRQGARQRHAHLRRRRDVAT